MPPPPPRPRAERARGRALRAVLACAALLSPCAHAHEMGDDALPATPGWRLGAAATGIAADADARWPTAAWPGVWTQGSAPTEWRRKPALEHATVEAGLRLPAQRGVDLAAHLALGLHDGDRAHVESARLLINGRLGGQDLALGLGRDTVSFGGLIDRAGHFDRFSQTPLAKRAALDGGWIDDGVRVAWLPGHETGIRTVEAGLWRARSFPGGAEGPAAPTLRLHAGWGHVDVHLSAARLEPRARGAAALSSGATGHVHGSLDCRATLQLRTCFDGRVDLHGASVAWQSEDGTWQLGAAGLRRREAGSVYSPSGEAQLHGTLQGGWLEAAWQALPAWTLSWRGERLHSRQHLAGVGAGLLALETGLAGSVPVTRQVLALVHEAQPGLSLALEAGTERSGAGQVRHVALRLTWQAPQLLQGQL